VAGPEDFTREATLELVGAKINRDLCWGTVGTGSESPQADLVRKLWGALEEVICPAESSIYSYQPDTDCDPLSSEGKVTAASSFPRLYPCDLYLSRRQALACGLPNAHALLLSERLPNPQIWAFNYFFYNKRLKRILYLSCMNSVDDMMMGDMDEDDDSDMMVGDLED
jgi:hypothetical protein